jgi:hypothetical protein
MTDKLISDLGSIGAALADNTATEVQRNGQTTTEQALLSDWKTWIKSWIAKADVGLGNVSNNAQLTIANNLSDLASAATARSSLGFGATFGPPSATGITNVYASNPCANPTAVALSALRLYMVPVYWPGGTATTFAFTVTTGASAGKVARVGIYNIKSDGTPGTLIVEPTSGGAIAVDTTGTKTASFSQAMSAGWYYLALATDGAPTVSGTGADGLVVLGIVLTGTSAGIPVYFIFRTLGSLVAFVDETGNTFSPPGVSSVRPNLGVK